MAKNVWYNQLVLIEIFSKIELSKHDPIAKLMMKSMPLRPLSPSKMVKSLLLTAQQRKKRKNERGGRKIVKTAAKRNKHTDWLTQDPLPYVKNGWFRFE